MSLTAATMKMMKAISLGQYPSMNGRSAIIGVKQIRTSVMMLGKVHMARRLTQRLNDVLADSLQCVEHPLAGQCDRLEVGRPLDPVPVLLPNQKLSIVIGIGSDF